MSHVGATKGFDVAHDQGEPSSQRTHPITVTLSRPGNISSAVHAASAPRGIHLTLPTNRNRTDADADADDGLVSKLVPYLSLSLPLPPSESGLKGSCATQRRLPLPPFLRSAANSSGRSGAGSSHRRRRRRRRAAPSAAVRRLRLRLVISLLARSLCAAVRRPPPASCSCCCSPPFSLLLSARPELA